MWTLLLAAALAHDHWLELAPAPDGLDVRVLVGEALESSEPAIPKEPGKYTRLVLRSKRHELDLRARVALADPLLHLEADELPRRGGVLVADARPISIELEPEKFAAYLEEEGIGGIVPPARAVHEVYSRHLKALLPGARDSVAGQELEIVLLRPPRTGRLVAAVWFRGAPLVGATVGVAVRDEQGRVEHRQVQTDARGRLELQTDRRGPWLLHLVHMLPDPSGAADFRSWWASLSMMVR